MCSDDVGCEFSQINAACPDCEEECYFDGEDYIAYGICAWAEVECKTCGRASCDLGC